MFAHLELPQKYKTRSLTIYAKDLQGEKGEKIKIKVENDKRKKKKP